MDIAAVHICPLSRDMIAGAKNLRIICTARGGTENINLTAATERGIAVLNTPHHNAEAVAEYTAGLMLSETRNIGRSASWATVETAGWSLGSCGPSPRISWCTTPLFPIRRSPPRDAAPRTCPPCSGANARISSSTRTCSNPETNSHNEADPLFAREEDGDT